MHESLCLREATFYFEILAAEATARWLQHNRQLLRVSMRFARKTPSVVHQLLSVVCPVASVNHQLLLVTGQILSVLNALDGGFTANGRFSATEKRCLHYKEDILMSNWCVRCLFGRLCLLPHGFQGLSHSEVKQAVSKLLACGPGVQEDLYRSWFSRSRQRMPSADQEKLDTLDKVDLTNEEQMELMQEYFGRNLETINFWLSKCVFPNETFQYPQKVTANPWHLADGEVNGFSGTADNRRILPLQVSQVTLPQLQVCVAVQPVCGVVSCGANRTHCRRSLHGTVAPPTAIAHYGSCEVPWVGAGVGCWTLTDAAWLTLGG